MSREQQGLGLSILCLARAAHGASCWLSAAVLDAHLALSFFARRITGEVAPYEDMDMAFSGTKKDHVMEMHECGRAHIAITPRDAAPAPEPSAPAPAPTPAAAPADPDAVTSY